jgi:hypothetical protein
MNIDRSNYEIWLIDWLDGNLSEIQVEQLRHFLSENPGLQEEFDELSLFNLKPARKLFPNKNRLQKTTANLSGLQLEYLSVAYLEKDLSPYEQTELKEKIEIDPEKKKSFELIQKMRLSPVSFSYKHKKRLLRRTVARNVIRLSLIGLSAAAIITLVVINSISIPRPWQVRFKKTSQTIVVDSTIQQPALEKVPKVIQTEKKVIISKKQIKNILALSPKTVSSISETNLNLPVENDSLVGSTALPRILINKIPVSQAFDLNLETAPNTLIALNYTVPVPEYEDERSRLSKFIAKTFREKILKEKSAKDSPLKVYEIAEAGVSGLDKLLGWEMALDEKKDVNGELKSVYFSSKILKFNAPVKKSEPLQ